MAVFAAMFAFVACTEGTDEVKKLATPELTETHTETSFTVAWNAVSGADAYVVNFAGNNYTTAECSYTFENLNGGTYSVRIKAIGKGYEDSDNASISVTLTGLTGDVDWFEQSVENLDEELEVEGMVLYPYNAFFFTWKGEGISNINYGVYTSAEYEGMSKSQIKAGLRPFDSAVLEYVNSAEGYTGIMGGLNGSTEYVFVAMVTNAAGLEYTAESTITTAEAELTAETKAWIGSYNATASQVIDINSNTISEQTTNFTFTVSPIEGSADQVYVDGLSIMGTDTPALGMVAADEQGNNLLAVWNYVMFSEMGEGWYLYWYALCYAMDDYYLVDGDFPALIFAQDKDGNITCGRYAGKLSNEAPFEVVAFDLIGVSEAGFGIPQDQDGKSYNVWKYGDYTNITKVEASAAALSSKPQITGVIPTSMVVLQ